ncbi:hypothetical protein G9U51_15670 [Calidifontibacter sp. DB0510]|uniref:Streptomycin 6-kinase n=1 Tax=Metallococcus carri TaxID=1656884 RepID=A0A967EBD9_9MICO|nr:aminoglycoside phosphotransferase family protein [Metallococcus carri]NHN57210.1 hypothetical protein [Metallococcus carri]NOP37987.1 hypothetical protein [Calidifontibacter sp. DB2511S]
MPWPLPLTSHAWDPDRPGHREGQQSAARLAPELADAWGLRRDGDAIAGQLGVVWPVRDAAGRALVLKIGDPPQIAAEALALSVWRPRGTAVELVASDATRGAMLLERLDPARDLEHHPDADEATAIIGDLLARSRSAAPTEVPRIAPELERIAESIRKHRDETPGLLPEPAVDRALATLADAVDITDTWLLHHDAHYLNVLHTLPGTDPGWRLIDPLPYAGPVEFEPIAMLRNRFADVADDPERGLRRRLDILVEVMDLDRALAVDLAQAVAVDNLLWLLPRLPDHFAVPPYSVLAHW